MALISRFPFWRRAGCSPAERSAHVVTSTGGRIRQAIGKSRRRNRRRSEICEHFRRLDRESSWRKFSKRSKSEPPSGQSHHGNTIVCRSRRHAMIGLQPRTGSSNRKVLKAPPCWAGTENASSSTAMEHASRGARVIAYGMPQAPEKRAPLAHVGYLARPQGGILDASRQIDPAFFRGSRPEPGATATGQ